MTGLPVKRMVGYADRMSACPGDTIRFMVSADGVGRYQARLVRLISGDRHPDGCGVIERPVASAIDGAYPGRHQALHAGSCAVIDPPGPLGTLASFSFQAMVWPTTPARPPQVVMGAFDPDDHRFFAFERAFVAQTVEVVREVTLKVDRSEYKRQQAAPGLKITSKAFNAGRTFPIAQRFRG